MNNFYCIKDENGNFVERGSICKCGKEWCYLTWNKPEYGYISQRLANDALSYLQSMNELAGMQHVFTIVNTDNTMMFAIQDEDTGRYLNKRSLQQVDDGKWAMTTYSGKLGTDFYTNSAGATETYDTLQELNKESGLNAKLHIIVVNTDSLPIGERVIRYQN